MEEEIMETHEPDVETTSTPEIAIESETTPSAELPIQTEEPTQQPDIATLIAEAEERGYLRGRNEKIAMRCARHHCGKQSENRTTILREKNISH